jgi:hypothetical protein
MSSELESGRAMVTILESFGVGGVGYADECSVRLSPRRRAGCVNFEFSVRPMAGAAGRYSAAESAGPGGARRGLPSWP